MPSEWLKSLSGAVLALPCALACVAEADPALPDPVLLDYTIVNTYPHRTSAFTQGLVFVGGNDGGMLAESTGRYGRSSIAVLNLQSGEARRETRLADELFGEGLTRFRGRYYQLTWRAGKLLVYNDALELVDELHYRGEGWGLTHDGVHLIVSDGSAELSFRRPADFSELRRLSVTERGRPVKFLNELEWIEGKVYANVWTRHRVVAIDPQSGAVTAVLDLTPLYQRQQRKTRVGVANGIAWDAATRRLFVTGKNWPDVFAIQLMD